MMRSGNPTLNDKIFETRSEALAADQTMTIQGTVNKTGILLVLVVISAAYTWQMFFSTVDSNPAAVAPYMIGGAIGGFVFALITIFKKDWAMITAPIYAVLEGLFLGGISAVFEAQYPGIASQAVGLTFGILFSLLLVYKSGLIKVTENFKLGVVAATGGIFLVYAASIILSFFGVRMPMIHESGMVGIGFSLFVVVIASLNLVLDFDFIEKGAERGAPKYMEWYGAFGLLVTLVWLYLEILRLLAKLQSRR